MSSAYRRVIEGYEYEWRDGPRGLGWYNDDNRWFLTAVEADQRTGLPARAATSDENTLAMLAHLLLLFTWIIGPLILYLVKGDSPHVRANAAEALNFGITLTIASIVSVVLMLVLVGILMILAVGLAAIVLPIMGAVAANRGETYRYPFNIRFVN